MSLYIGKDNSNNSIIHITSNPEPITSMKSTSRLPSTVFLSTLPIPEIIYVEYVSIPTATTTLSGSSVLSSSIVNYMNDPNYYVLQYVLINGYCYESLMRKVFVFTRENGTKRICNLDSSNNGQIALFIVTRLTSFPSGSISISKSDILIGNTSISSKRWLMYNTYYSSQYAINYRLTNNTFMSIVDSSGSNGFRFSKDKIQYDKNGSTYDLLSVATLSRANTYVLSSSYSDSSLSSISWSIPAIDNTNLQTVVIKIPLLMFSMTYYGGGSGVHIGLSFDICVKSTENMRTILNFAPYTLLYITWSAIHKNFSIAIATQTPEVDALYTSGNKYISYYSV